LRYHTKWYDIYLSVGGGQATQMVGILLLVLYWMHADRSIELL